MTDQPFRTLELTGPHEETPAQRELRRTKLQRLDRCLDLLENAMEKDCTVVDARVAAVLAETTPLLAEGMAVPDAIEVVLLLQEAYMLPVIVPAPLKRFRPRF
jgi:hypothetical protein